MKIKPNLPRVAVLILTIIFLVTAVTFEIFELSSLPAQFFGTLLGVVITAIITVLLLQGQTKSEESRERNIMVFEKKQSVFFHFLTQLNTILQKEKLALHLHSDKNLEKEVNNLQDLLFEFGFLQMHTSAETFDKILSHIGNLMEENKKIKKITDKTEQDFEVYYETLSNDFFSIVNLLKLELYNITPNAIDKSKLDRIIKLSF
jgi:mevalonate kinase